MIWQTYWAGVDYTSMSNTACSCVVHKDGSILYCTEHFNKSLSHSKGIDTPEAVRDPLLFLTWIYYITIILGAVSYFCFKVIALFL